MKTRYILSLLTIAALIPSQSHALINPNFTPLTVMEQSLLVAKIKFSPIKKGKVQASITEFIQGTNASKILEFNLTDSAFKKRQETLEKTINQSGDETVLFFIGAFEEQTEDGGEDEEVEKEGFLHVHGKWYVFFSDKNGVWEFDGNDEKSNHLEGTWAGSTDMFLKAIRYILAYPDDADIPPRTFSNWNEEMMKIAKLDGQIYAVKAVSLDKTGKHHLHISAEKGDKLFVYDRKAESFKDITPATKLRTASKVSLWLDVNRDTRMDLLSWDGKSLTINTQSIKGIFSSKPIKDIKLTDCLSMSLTDMGTSNKVGVVLGTKNTPILMTLKTEVSASFTSLTTGGDSAKDMGQAGQCIVADLDADNIPDVIQLFADGSLFYKGKKAGSYSAPVKNSVMLGLPPWNAFLGDFDANGLLDIFVAAKDFSKLWHNYGNMKFMDMIHLSGEMAYISKPDAIDGMTGDINNDGRQDILIVYSSMLPQLFFNRGFRSFGHSHAMDIAEKTMLSQEENKEGGQAGCLGDFDCDGGQDMILAEQNGTIWAAFRDTEENSAYAATAYLPTDGKCVGPITVTCWVEERCLGAWNVVAGSQEAFLDQLESGEYTFKWQTPGEDVKKKTFVINDKPVRIKIK
ncbi:MAG: VCBS repeat-containing protein [Kiritimatiellae bacterium]|nr:VCBS repeat-containing protein [Kiritimatiellia bacterium]